MGNNDDTEEVLLGDLLDGLSVRMRPLKPGQLPESAVVLIKVIDTDGIPFMHPAWSDGMSWMDRRAMVEVLRDSLRFSPENGPQD